MKIAISGTTSGIGRALYEFLSLDHEILPINRDQYNLNNISSLESIDLTGVDVLINNAGHAVGGGKGFATHSPDDWQNVFSTNLLSPIFLTQLFLNQNQSGKIIFITSKIVEKNLGGDAAYAASKAGLSTFIACLREELVGSKIQLIEIRPGRVKTNFTKNRKVHSEETLATFFDTRSHMHPSEIVQAIVFAMNSGTVNTITLEK